MKRTIVFFLCLILAASLCACGEGNAFHRETEHIPETTYEGTLNSAETEVDMGISCVNILTPDSLTATVDAPSVSFSVVFTGINPGGAPEGGRHCSVKLIRDSEVISCDDDFTLTEGARIDYTVDYEFSRYAAQKDSRLIVELDYGEEYRIKTIPVKVMDYPDEYYAMSSRDPYPYAITIIVNKNVAIVYGKDDAGEYTKPVKVFICSTGVNTPERGTYKLLHKYEWKELIHDLWGQYATWITGDILIHSLPYFSPNKDDMWSWQFNRLGGAVSTGCIRMRCCDTKWIFDYCPCGTPVTFVIERDLPEGIEYPTYDHLDLESPDAGWDPTDPDPANPWKPAQPDDHWKTLIPYFDALYEAYTALDCSEYEKFAKTSEIFAPEEPAEP